MKKNLFSLIPALLILTSCSSPTALQSTSLRYNGIYQGPKEVDTPPFWEYLRFYPDGTVLEVSSTGTPKDLRPWFVKGNGSISTGQVQLQRRHISFEATSKEGTVTYVGNIEDNVIRLHGRSLINGNEFDREFHFVPWPAP